MALPLQNYDYFFSTSFGVLLVVPFVLGLTTYYLYTIPKWFQPLGLFLIGKSVDDLHDNPELDVTINSQLKSYVTKIVLGSIQTLMWVYFAIRFPEWLEEDWATYCMPQDNKAEYSIATICYIYYLSYVWFSTSKDFMKKRDESFSFADVTFDLHHLIAIFLTIFSLQSGLWRAGFLTRLIHTPTDIVLYGNKTIKLMLDSRKIQHYFIDVYLMGCTCVFWIITRVVLYGYLCWCLVQMVSSLLHSYLAIALCLASGAMWVLQVLWAFGAIEMLMKTITKGRFQGDVNHPNHDQKKRS